MSATGGRLLTVAALLCEPFETETRPEWLARIGQEYRLIQDEPPLPKAVPTPRRVLLVPIVCGWCEAVFKPRGSKQRCCSRECGVNLSWQTRLEATA